MKSIQKYVLDLPKGLCAGIELPDKKCELKLPDGAIIRKVAFQQRILHLWVEQDNGAVLVTRKFRVFAKSDVLKHDIKTRLGFIETAFIGEFVFHIYEEIKL